MVHIVKMNRLKLIGLCGVLLITLVPQSVFARDMHGRLGLGYNSQFSNYTQTGGVPGISLKYGLSRSIAIEGVFGLTTSSPKNSVTAIKIFSNILYETNLNFYFLLGGGILGITPSGASTSETSVEFLAGFGAEFFIPGLESLGFSMETGISLNNVAGSFALKTMGFNFLNAGIHFYF